MFNAQQITSRLASMSDAQLAQYARMHKEDPYILPLAAAEAKRRQQMRQQATAMQAPQNPPTVADTAVAQMAPPESTGLGTLNAQNLDSINMAEGGIVAFADRGLVEDSMSADERAELEARERSYLSNIIPSIKRGVSDWWQGIQQVPLESQNPMLKYKTPKNTGVFEYERPKEKLERLRAEERDTGGGKYTGQNFGAAGAIATPDELLARRQQGVGYTTAAGDRYTDVPPRAQAESQTAPRPSVTGAPKSAGTAQPGFVPTQSRTLEQEVAGVGKVMPQIGPEYDALAKATEEKYKALEEERARTKPKGKAYEGLEALLKKEEEAASDKEARNLKMSLINAGLAIAGGKSQYALQNIAEGAQVGTKQYQAGLEKLEEAAKERQRQAATIDEARRAEERGDWQEAMKLRQQAMDANLGIKKAKIDGIAKITGDTVKVAADRVNTLDTLAAGDRRALMQQQEETKRAHIMANAYGQRAMDRGILTPALLLKEYNDRVAADKFGDFQKQFPTFQHYAAMFPGLGSSNAGLVEALPPDARVRK